MTQGRLLAAAAVVSCAALAVASWIAFELNRGLAALDR